MALVMLRRSAAAAAPLAMRLVGRSRHHTSAGLILSAARHGGAARRFFPSAVHFSTEPDGVSIADETLIEVLEKEIGCAENEEVTKDAEDIPVDFPFKIEDNAGESVVKLTRQYEGERVEVEVYGVSCDNEDDDDSDDVDSLHTLTLVVRISKDVGPYLEFNCKATPDEISIEDILFKDPEATEESAYVGPYFVDLDEVIQKAFHKYLAARGITTGAMDYMLEYMENKDTREYKIWLDNLKKFVEA